MDEQPTHLPASAQDNQPTIHHRGRTATVSYSETTVAEASREALNTNLVQLDDDRNAASTAYKLLRTKVLRKLEQHNWNALAITSPNTGEGKTSTAVNLATSIAQTSDYTVLLADLDLRKPSVHEFFGLAPKFGVLDHLLEQQPIGSILLNPGIERLVLLPGRGTSEHSAELLASAPMVNMVAELKSRYPDRIVLFDLPPLLSAADGMAFSPYVDAVLLIIEEGKTTQSSVLQALDYLRSTNVIGAVLNKSSRKLENQ